MNNIIRFVITTLFSVVLFSGYSRVIMAADKKIVTGTPIPLPTIDYTLPYPGILPDHPLYFVKNIRDQILILFTRDIHKKSEIYLLLADKNIVMAQTLWGKGDIELSKKYFNISEDYLFKAASVINNLQNYKDVPAFINRLHTSTLKHKEIIGTYLSGNKDEKIEKGLKNALVTSEKAQKSIPVLK